MKIHKLDQHAANAREGGTRWRELDVQKRALLEHRTEVQSRLSKGVLHADKLHAMHDIAEELETINAEMDLNRVRLEEERRKVLKGPGAGTKGYNGAKSGVGGVDETTVQNEAAALLREMTDRGIGQVLIADSSGNALQQSLCKLAMHTVEAKYRLSHAQNDIREVRCRLDDKECEVEELQECITRLKNDHMRKLNELRKESEDKVGALMTKLRAAEARTLEAEDYPHKQGRFRRTEEETCH